MKQKSFIINIVSLAMAASVIICSCKPSIEGPPPPPPPTAAPPDQPATQKVNIFTKSTEGYSCFRIPAIVKTKTGTLLAFAEARKNSCADNGDIDLVVKRSTDNGVTWGKTIKVWDDGTNTCGNPVPIVDQSTGDIILVMSWNRGSDDIGAINNGTGVPRRVYVTRSSDDGVTWATPTNVSATTTKPEWGWISTGPCHGIQLTKGTNAGRLVVPSCFIEANKDATKRKQSAYMIYSDDHGATWQMGNVADPGAFTPNESTVVELSDGKLLLNSRCSGKSFRVSSLSADGGVTWATVQGEYALVDPVSQGSLLGANYNNNYLLFFSNDASTTRVNMSISTSKDNGKTWAKRFVVNTGQSAYSDIAIVSDTLIGITYETGQVNPYELIRFESYSLNYFK
ncbi:MAG: exo-alpha-sialidase [Filimonas sp.]|nr:exo-alpha-sialidase [Filimonas sp.]